jgi:hypothetical protein
VGILDDNVMTEVKDQISAGVRSFLGSVIGCSLEAYGFSRCKISFAPWNSVTPTGPKLREYDDRLLPTSPCSPHAEWRPRGLWGWAGRACRVQFHKRSGIPVVFQVPWGKDK